MKLNSILTPEYLKKIEKELAAGKLQLYGTTTGDIIVKIENPQTDLEKNLNKSAEELIKDLNGKKLEGKELEEKLKYLKDEVSDRFKYFG